MITTAASLQARIETELLEIADPRVVALVRRLLVEPTAISLDWDYADWNSGAPNEKYPGWIVLDDSVGSDTAIAYCEHGFGPRFPWGLVAAAPEDGRRWMGQDSAWFATFMEAFMDSFAALEIERHGVPDGS